jgi:hypothetical protein
LELGAWSLELRAWSLELRAWSLELRAWSLELLVSGLFTITLVKVDALVKMGFWGIASWRIFGGSPVIPPLETETPFW